MVYESDGMVCEGDLMVCEGDGLVCEGDVMVWEGDRCCVKVKQWHEDERLVWKGEGLLCESDGMVFFFFNCIDTYISTYQLAGDTFIMNKYLNGIVTTIYNCYIVGIKGCYIKWIILYTFFKSNKESIAEDIL